MTDWNAYYLVLSFLFIISGMCYGLVFISDKDNYDTIQRKASEKQVKYFYCWILFVLALAAFALVPLVVIACAWIFDQILAWAKAHTLFLTVVFYSIAAGFILYKIKKFRDSY
jgi:hypothetical protein